MRQLLIAGLAAVLLLGCGAPFATAGADQQPVLVRPSVQPPLGSLGPSPLPQTTTPMPRSVPLPSRPAIACDQFGRCWQQSPNFGFSPGSGVRPPGWADDLPRRARDPDRFIRPRSGVVCDAASSICYKQGRIDKSETRAMFGDRAADRADDLRDERGTGRLFVPERGVTCDTARRTCYDGNVPDFSLTRRYFGQRAADALR
ncbi:YcgJ family protein [Benzoatithermus flavus]|uniref:YcgJ family protein n=1 Tax=Benzoatithermus flavus TaxID=3108223 RepID=A0ABU8XW95_9PROT